MEGGEIELSLNIIQYFPIPSAYLPTYALS